MIDREKVIKGLEFCTQHGSMCGSDCNGHYERYTDDGYVIKLVDEYRSECPYGKCETGCVKTLAKDALELLKEHEPRVLTLEEVQNDCPDYVYLETTSGWFECCIKDEGESDTYLGDFAYGIDEYFIKRWREYGTTWRCWSTNPTDEQREAVKWDEGVYR